jgi:hypothetical protein
MHDDRPPVSPRRIKDAAALAITQNFAQHSKILITCRFTSSKGGK